MKKNNLISMILIIAASLLLSSCGGGSKDMPYIDIHKGTSAFTMSYIENAPPPTVFAPERGSESTFEIALRMQNNGAYNIDEAYLNLILEKDYMAVTQWNIQDDEGAVEMGMIGDKITFDLDGKSQFNPYGQEKFITITANALPIDEMTETHTSSIIAVACYGYVTEANPEICIDTDFYNLKPIDKVCNVKDVGLSGGQGAPIEVTKVEVKMFPSGESFIKPQFIIHVSNSGNGEVVGKDKVNEACSAEPLNHEDINVVDIEEISFSSFALSKGDFECFPESLKLRQGRGEFRCSLKDGKLSTETETFKTPLFIRLDYGYTFTIAKNTVIEKLLKY